MKRIERPVEVFRAIVLASLTAARGRVAPGVTAGYCGLSRP
jgi:hypothetical protein